MSEPIPFAEIQSASLAQAESLLRQWFPRGRRVGREYKIGNLDGDAGDSLSINITTGRWADFAAAESGHDLIDLAARLHHGGNRIEAARDLGRQLGIVNGTPTQATGDRPSGGDWQPILPPPANAGRPPDVMFRDVDLVYEYTDLNDAVTHYVGRIEAKNGRRKQFVPVTYGVLAGRHSWQWRGPDAPKPLYGLNRLSAFPDATVLLCEGEKAADAAQQLFPDHACLSWFGGVGSVNHADLTPLAGRNVIIWPDNDAPGHEATATLARKLPHARLLDVHDLPPGADAADVHPEDPEAWLAARLAPDNGATLRDFLAIEAWAERDIPPADRLLGDLLTTTSRTFLVGRTGLGKTLLAVGIACGIASGEGFLHWRCDRPRRVLIVDGEMPGELIRARAIDALRRCGVVPVPGNLLIYARDTEDDFAKLFPSLGPMPPLNTEHGMQWLLDLIAAIGGADVVILDNVMSLLEGIQKEEEAWKGVEPLVLKLTSLRIGQLWLDHTGHDSSRQYGSSTKAWKFDSVGIMTPLLDDQRAPNEVAFTLSFEHPGKARRRTPANRQDFETRIIRLADDRWTSQPVNRSGAPNRKPVPRSRQVFHDALLDAIAAGNTTGPGQVSRSAWEAECIRRSLMVARDAWDGSEPKRTQDFRRAISELQAANWIGCDGNTFTDLSRSYASK